MAADGVPREQGGRHAGGVEAALVAGVARGGGELARQGAIASKPLPVDSDERAERATPWASKCAALDAVDGPARGAGSGEGGLLRRGEVAAVRVGSAKGEGGWQR